MRLRQVTSFVVMAAIAAWIGRTVGQATPVNERVPDGETSSSAPSTQPEDGDSITAGAWARVGSGLRLISPWVSLGLIAGVIYSFAYAYQWGFYDRYGVSVDEIGASRGAVLVRIGAGLAGSVVFLAFAVAMAASSKEAGKKRNVFVSLVLWLMFGSGITIAVLSILNRPDQKSSAWANVAAACAFLLFVASFLALVLMWERPDEFPDRSASRSPSRHAVPGGLVAIGSGRQPRDVKRVVQPPEQHCVETSIP